MTLTATEQRALARIADGIQSRDPRLRSLFAIFTRLTRHEAMPTLEQLVRHRWRPRATMVLPLALMLMAAIIVVGSLVTSAHACRPVAAGAGPATQAAPNAANRSDLRCTQR